VRIPPATAAGVTGKLWTISDIMQVLEDWERRNDECQNADFGGNCFDLFLFSLYGLSDSSGRRKRELHD